MLIWQGSFLLQYERTNTPLRGPPGAGKTIHDQCVATNFTTIDAAAW